MAKPYIHAESSARKFGGKAEDYLDIHELMDSSKLAVPDNRHRLLTHHSWFIETILPRVFGSTIKNSKGKIVSVKEIGYQHVMEDFHMKFVPTAQDYIENVKMKDWMNNAITGTPNSAKKAKCNIKGKKLVVNIKDVTIVQ
jgi:hypothetical protein